MNIKFIGKEGKIGKLTVSLEEYVTIYDVLRSSSVFDQAFALDSIHARKVLNILEDLEKATPWIKRQP